ncbi:MAG: phage holin family protein [Burkholderiaceae bacterium]
MATTNARDGLAASVKSMAGTLLAMAQTRLALFGNEVEVEKHRLLRLLLLSQALMFSSLLAALLAVAFLTLWLWEYRLGVLALCIALFAGLAWRAYRALMQLVHSPESPFSTSLTQLQEDLRQLKAASGHATTPD